MAIGSKLKLLSQMVGHQDQGRGLRRFFFSAVMVEPFSFLCIDRDGKPGCYVASKSFFYISISAAAHLKARAPKLLAGCAFG